MSNALAFSDPLHTWDDSFLEPIKQIADGPLKSVVIDIDKGLYPLDIMRQLGEAGALGCHLKKNGTRVGNAIAAMQSVSRVCGSTGFLMWTHQVCGLYMQHSKNASKMAAALDQHERGATFGGTALSNPMKAIAGIEKMVLRAKRVDGGYLVTGSLPWVSHIGKGQYCGAIAGVVNDAGDFSHEIMFMLTCTDDVELRPCPHFSGMEGTSTWGIRLKDHFVSDDSIVADPSRPLILEIRGVFILLQTGMALGVIEGSIASMKEVESTLGHVNQFLHNRPDELQNELNDLRGRIMDLALTPYETDRDYFMNVLDARVQSAELALRASQSALLHQGARGYLMSSDPQRRIREAHFVAIVTPAIKHLRWEMSRLSKEEFPA